jgi:predicted MFS family arabinose efflux permease
MSIITLGGLAGLSFGVIYGGWASEHHGWRFALISVGLAGSLLSFLFWFTVADRRSELDSHQAGPDLLQTLRLLAANRAFVLLVMAACAVSMGAYGRALWEPTFLRRVYGMGAAEAGGWFFIIGPLPSAVGALASGFLIDRLAHRDPRWYAWLPGLGALLLLPAICLFYLLPADGPMIGSMPVAFIFSILASLMSTTWVPTTMCLAQSLSPPQSLAVTAAVWSMLSNFLGYGLGPLLVGDANVRLEGLYGDEAIRYSLVATSGMTVVGAALYFAVAANLRKVADP